MKQVPPQPQHGALTDGDHQAVVAVGSHNAHRHQKGKLHQGDGQAAEVVGAAGEHGDHVVIHQGLGEGGGHHRGRGRQQDAANHQYEGQLVRVEHIAQDPVQHSTRAPPGSGFIHAEIPPFRRAGRSRRHP